MNARIRRSFDRAGADYAATAISQRIVAAACAEGCPGGLHPTVLEIGAGVGFVAQALAGRMQCMRYLALDLAEGMLRAWPEPLASRVLRIVADAEAPPLRPRSMDLLVSSAAMHWFSSPETSIPACLGLLKPGGAFSIAIYVAGTLQELAEVCAETGFGSVFPLRNGAFYQELLAAEPSVSALRIKEIEHRLRFPDPVALLRSLQGAGVTHTDQKLGAGRERLQRFLQRYVQLHHDGHGGVHATYKDLAAAAARTAPSAPSPPITPPAARPTPWSRSPPRWRPPGPCATAARRASHW